VVELGEDEFVPDSESVTDSEYVDDAEPESVIEVDCDRLTDIEVDSDNVVLPLVEFELVALCETV
jgi:hypothetical protein